VRLKGILLSIGLISTTLDVVPINLILRCWRHDARVGMLKLSMIGKICESLRIKRTLRVRCPRANTNAERKVIAVINTPPRPAMLGAHMTDVHGV
jgi:hypothetical protein